VGDVDVIIVTFNSAASVEAAIASVLSASMLMGVVIVDNASRDSSATTVRNAGAHVVIENDRNQGFARAVNQGLKTCSSDYVLLLNPDATLTEASLARMCFTLRSEAGAAIVAPLLRDAAGNTESGAGRFATLTRRVGLCLPIVGRAPYFKPQYSLSATTLSTGRPLDVDYAFGAALLLKRSFLQRTGGLDERYFLFAEDEDICRQAHAYGHRVVLDTRAVAGHIGGASYSDSARISAQRLFSTYRLLGKWRGMRAAKAYHRGIVTAFWLRVQAARAQGCPDEAASVERTSLLFDAAVKSDVEPLLAETETARAKGLI
jgi:GT2 family glycosyltransferase